MQVQFDQLATFLAVLEEGTFDAAARRLQVTPSAVSQRIKALEVGAGRVLLQRTKPAQPTESGRILARLARQTTLLTEEAAVELGGAGPDRSATSEIPIVINADSLATWALPPLARLATEHGLRFDIHREDEQHSVDLLRAGTVMAAVTGVAEPVQGCGVRRLGRMRYLLVASQEYAERWLPGGLTVDNLAHAPVLAFDHKDDLQDRYPPPSQPAPAAAAAALSALVGRVRPGRHAVDGLGPAAGARRPAAARRRGGDHAGAGRPRRRIAVLAAVAAALAGPGSGQRGDHRSGLGGVAVTAGWPRGTHR